MGVACSAASVHKLPSAIFLQTNSTRELGFSLIYKPELKKTSLFSNAQAAYISGERFCFSSAFPLLSLAWTS